MKRSKNIKAPSSGDSARAEENELSGCLGLAMKRQSLSLARRILKRPKLTETVFIDCLRAVERFARRPKEWRELLETAYGRLNIGDREKVRFSMLLFFDGNIREPVATLRYAPKKMTRRMQLCDLLITWCCWLKLEEMDKLKAAVPIISSAIQTAKYSGMSSFLANAYAQYWALRAEIEGPQSDKMLLKAAGEAWAAECETEASQLPLKGIAPKNLRR
jgi:hypothetical protein